MVKVLGGIAGSILVGIGGLLIGLLVKFRHDWNYMKKLRSSIPSSNDNCEYYMLCGLFKIFFGCFLCRCCCCKVEEPEVSMGEEGTAKNGDINDGENLEDCEVWEVWEDFLRNETIKITQDDLSYMRQKYINYQYSHGNYCFKKPGEKCNSRECFHHRTIDWKGLIQHPVLYFIELNFDNMTKKCAQMNVTNMKPRDDYLHWPFEAKKYIEFVFKAALEPIFSENQNYKNIEKSLGEKINNICLVINGFPSEYKHDFKKEEIYLLRTVISLRKNCEVPLIYNVR